MKLALTRCAVGMRRIAAGPLAPRGATPSTSMTASVTLSATTRHAIGMATIASIRTASATSIQGAPTTAAPWLEPSRAASARCGRRSTPRCIPGPYNTTRPRGLADTTSAATRAWTRVGHGVTPSTRTRDGSSAMWAYLPASASRRRRRRRVPPHARRRRRLRRLVRRRYRHPHLPSFAPVHAPNQWRPPTATATRCATPRSAYGIWEIVARSRKQTSAQLTQLTSARLRNSSRS
mmetsp:Transcript_17557/g.40206  ORF Transcript_17557/g.40206 Transcript_17557/m.40206 type:complete len:235 (+) Transcript_17557:1240-1944(+)